MDELDPVDPADAEHVEPIDPDPDPDPDPEGDGAGPLNLEDVDLDDPDDREAVRRAITGKPAGNPEPGSRRERLTACEQVIEANLEGVFAVGRALQEVKDDELWRITGAESFTEWVRDRFELQERQANRTMAASRVTAMLPAGEPIPRNEAVARELVPLEGTPDTVREAWSKVVGEYGDRPTAPQVKVVVSQFLPVKPAPEGVDEESAEQKAAREAVRLLTEAGYDARSETKGKVVTVKVQPTDALRLARSLDGDESGALDTDDGEDEDDDLDDLDLDAAA